MAWAWRKGIWAAVILIAAAPLIPVSGTSAAVKSCSSILPAQTRALLGKNPQIAAAFSKDITRVYALSDVIPDLSSGAGPAEYLQIKNGKLEWLGATGDLWPPLAVLGDTILVWQDGKSALFFPAGSPLPCSADYMFEAQDTERYQLQSRNTEVRLRQLDVIEAMLLNRLEDVLDGEAVHVQYDPDKTPVWPAIDQALSGKPWAKQIIAQPLRHGLRGPQLHLPRRGADAAQTYRDVNPLLYQTQIIQTPPSPLRPAGVRINGLLHQGRDARFAHIKGAIDFAPQFGVAVGGSYLGDDFTPIAALQARMTGPQNSFLHFSLGRLGRTETAASVAAERSFQNGKWHGLGQITAGQGNQAALGLRATSFGFMSSADLGLTFVANHDDGTWGHSASAALYFGRGVFRPVLGAALSNATGPELFAGLHIDFGAPRTDLQVRAMLGYSGVQADMAAPLGGWIQPQLPDLRQDAIRRDWRHIARLP
jgi:hypothetical protein